MKKIVGLKAKIYTYLINDSREDKKEKDKKLCLKRKLKTCLGATQLENKISHQEKK